MKQMYGMSATQYANIEKKYKERKKRNRGILAVCIYSLAVIAFFSIAAAVLNIYFSTDSTAVRTKALNNLASAQTKPVYPIPADILPITNKLGIPSDNNHLQFVVSNDIGKSCNIDFASACYKSSGNVILYQPSLLSSNSYRQTSTIGHEYLHYIWANTSDKEKESIKKHIMTVYLSNHIYLDKRLTEYYAHGMVVGDEEFYDELHSYIGTEMRDSEMPPSLLQHYTTYLPNRNVLPSLF